jgi:hypothetical protein
MICLIWLVGLNLYLKGEDKVEKNNANDKEGANWKFNSVIQKYNYYHL